MITLTNRFHVAVRLFSNRSQMTSKCGKNKKVAHEAIAECVTSAYLFQIAREKSCDYLLIIYMKKFEMVKQKKRTRITQSGKNCAIIAPSRARAHFCCLTNSCPFVVVFIL